MSFRSAFPRPLRAWAGDALSPGGPPILAVGLVAGLVLLAPLFALAVGFLSLPVPLPLLVGVAIVGACYAAVVVLSGAYLRGFALGVVVTATFAADLPLTAGAESYPGSLAPDLLLVYGPLLALSGLLALRGDFSTDSFCRVEYAFGAFVAWSVVVAGLGAVPRWDTALYYSLFSLAALLAFAVLRRAVESGAMTLREVVHVFLVAVVGHVAFAIVQIANQGPLGLSFLGETTRTDSRILVEAGPLGEFEAGVIVSGLTGGVGPLSVLIVVALPTLLAVAWRRRGWWRAGGLLAAVTAAWVLNVTGKDSARGAAIVGLALFGAYLLRADRRPLRELVGSPRRLARPAAVTAALGVALLYPSTLLPAEDESSTGASGGSAGGAVGGVDPATLSIPFFDLHTLGVRFAQYVVALDIAVKHPLFGVGGANYVYAAADYGVGSIEGLPVHNFYLSVLAGTGVPGLLLYGAAIALALLAGWRLLESGTAEPVLVAGVLAGLVGVLAVLFWINHLRYTYMLSFWLLAGALVGERRRLDGGGATG